MLKYKWLGFFWGGCVPSSQCWLWASPCSFLGNGFWSSLCLLPSLGQDITLCMGELWIRTKNNKCGFLFVCFFLNEILYKNLRYCPKFKYREFHTNPKEWIFKKIWTFLCSVFQGINYCMELEGRSKESKQCCFFPETIFISFLF